MQSDLSELISVYNPTQWAVVRSWPSKFAGGAKELNLRDSAQAETASIFLHRLTRSIDMKSTGGITAPENRPRYSHEKVSEMPISSVRTSRWGRLMKLKTPRRAYAVCGGKFSTREFSRRELNSEGRARSKGEILARAKGDAGQGEVVVPRLREWLRKLQTLAIADPWLASGAAKHPLFFKANYRDRLESTPRALPTGNVNGGIEMYGGV